MRRFGAGGYGALCAITHGREAGRSCTIAGEMPEQRLCPFPPAFGSRGNGASAAYQAIAKGSSHSIREVAIVHRKITLLLISVFTLSTALALTACNTVEGAGKDIEAGGQSIKDEANKNK